MENTAIKIQTTMVQSYRARNESPSKVFTLLGLTDEEDDVISTSQLKSWMKYVEDFNKRNHKHDSWFIPFHNAYNVERILKRAIQTSSTAKIDKMLQKEWIKYWVGKEMSPKYTFLHLYLKEAGDKTLITTAFKLWIIYLNAFNKRYPEQNITIIEGIRTHYNDINLLDMFNMARNDPTTDMLVTNLENAYQQMAS